MFALSHDNLIQTANSLPPLPQSVLRLSELFADVDYEIKDVARVVELDPILAGKLLKMANSLVYGVGKVSTVRDAIVRVGAGSVKSLAIAASVRPPGGLNLQPFGLTAASYWQHCVSVLSFAEEIASRRVARFGDDFCTAALLHDFGKLVLAKHLQVEQIEAMQALDSSLSGSEREMRVLSVNHAEVTAVVAQNWNLPTEVVMAVQYHHAPSTCDTPMCHGLNIANQLAWRLEERDFELKRESTSLLHSLNALALTDKDVSDIFLSGGARVEAALEIYN